MPASAPGLEKSIKHTTLRKKAQLTYENEIEDVYGNEANQGETLSADAPKKVYGDDEILEAVTLIVKEVALSVTEIKDDDNFFDLGIDSSAAIRIRARIQQTLIPQDAGQLPMNVLYDCGNISRLTIFIVSFRHGKSENANDSEEEIKLMSDFCNKYSFERVANGHDPAQRNGHYASEALNISSDGRQVVLLTGVTGTLGAHVFSQLHSSSDKPEIHCLIRASNRKSAIERAAQALSQRQLPPFDLSTDNVHFHPCKLSDTSLGLPRETYESLRNRVTLIVHAAWAVNFTMRLSSFENDHIKGLYNLLRLANIPREHSAPPRFVFCSSTASVLGPNLNTDIIPERMSRDEHAPMALGYSRSKWVAEAICGAAYQDGMHGRLKVIRIGQLCGDTERGIWNVTEAWPLMLSSSQVTHTLPDLGQEKLGWLPVDTAARAVLEIAMSQTSPDMAPAECPVYHVVNSSNKTTWTDLLGWISKLSPDTKILPPAEWVSLLEQSGQKGEQHPALKLLDLWRRNYVEGNTTSPESAPPVVFDMTHTKKESFTMRDVPAIGEEHFQKIWEWLRGETEKVKQL